MVHGTDASEPAAIGGIDPELLRPSGALLAANIAVAAAIDRAVADVGQPPVVLDLLTSADPEVAALHNAIERLRDPSHTALVAREALAAEIADAGFRSLREEVWESRREFGDWARVIAEPARMASLEVLLRHLARAGVETGMGLREERDGALAFTYAWGLFVAEVR